MQGRGRLFGVKSFLAVGMLVGFGARLLIRFRVFVELKRMLLSEEGRGVLDGRLLFRVRDLDVGFVITKKGRDLAVISLEQK